MTPQTHIPTPTVLTPSVGLTDAGQPPRVSRPFSIEDHLSDAELLSLAVARAIDQARGLRS